MIKRALTAVSLVWLVGAGLAYSPTTVAEPLQAAASSTFHQSLAWSPDGARITFSALRNKNWDVYLAGADGSGEVRLTMEPSQDRYSE